MLLFGRMKKGLMEKIMHSLFVDSGPEKKEADGAAI